VPDYILPDTAKLGECEFWLISEIKAQLIIHHPYRSLNELQTKLELSQDEMSVAWSVVNDHYVTDLSVPASHHCSHGGGDGLDHETKPGQTCGLWHLAIFCYGCKAGWPSNSDIASTCDSGQGGEAEELAFGQ
jgi:hypothetical protein